ncbi:MAG: hydrogenase expression/formation protein HypE [Chloroflexi bacterium]|nr:hydrogenase expression/formation protein HypE [Chloroflexota bacterium]MBU1746084.1 hydrogenase expression/formation protein HypE [Chloroflexota bacterium]
MTETVLLAHGSGGRLSHDLVRDVFAGRLTNPLLDELDDAAVFALPAGAGRLAFTTDSYVVQPLFFPGGDIGKLAVCGTVNDLAMRGATPLYLSAGFIIEEGFPLADLARIVDSMAGAAREAGVSVVTGDTKIVNRGAADKVFINTAGVGVVPPGVNVGASRVQPGDAVLVSGPVGDHGMAVMTQREGLRFQSLLVSDCAPLNGLVAAMLAAAPGAVHCLRDATRGGLATVLVEVADTSRVGIEVDETAIPVREPVRAACELLGLDPLYVANEGTLVAFCAADAADAVLTAMRAHSYGREAVRIGRTGGEHPGRVALRTALGVRRVLDMLAGEQLPRIC